MDSNMVPGVRSDNCETLYNLAEAERWYPVDNRHPGFSHLLVLWYWE